MRTSEQIYHQVRWDPRFDPARFVLGVELRGRAPKRIPLPAFTPGGDIPWHRVRFVEADGVLVWDRSSGIDTIDSAGVGLARRTLRLAAPHFAARTPRRWTAGTWTDAPGTAAAAADSSVGTAAPAPASPNRPALRVLTWNVLWDRYDGDRIHTARRTPLLLAALARADADVIALQEVQAPLLARLLAEPWVRAGYAVTVDARGRDVDEAGLLVLSRLPVLEAGWCVLGAHKAMAAVVVETAGGPVAVAATHLSSDHSEDAVVRRASELLKLRAALEPVDCPVVVAGDFNDATEGADGPAGVLRLADAWSVVRGAADRTPTFDPTVNPLAAVSSRTGRAVRIDRVLTRGGLRPTTAELQGTVPDADGLFVSDHFGLSVGFEPGDAAPAGPLLDVPPTARTALAWLPPADVCGPVQEVRAVHDPSFDRWPPHVNVLFGFVAEAEFEAAAGLLAEALRAVAPFETRLSGVRSFGHQGSVTAWLDPAPDGDDRWQALHAAAVARFPGCRPRRESYTPHLTIAKLRDAAQVRGLRPGSGTARVGTLALLSRRGDEPMRVRAEIALGTGTVRWADDDERPTDADRTAAVAGTGIGIGIGIGIGTSTSTVAETAATGRGATASHALPAGGSDVGRPCAPGVRPSRQDLLAADVTTLITTALPDATVHTTGSRATGCALPDADLDLVAVGPAIDVARVRAALAAALPPRTHFREVVGARVPGLRFRVGPLSVDLTLVDAALRTPAEALAFGSVADVARIRELVSGREPLFAGTARLVKAWARARGLDSAPFGGVPGVVWSLLTAEFVADGGAEAAELFGALAARDWTVPVPSPSDPDRDLIALVGPGFRDLVGEEAYRGWEALLAGDVAALRTPPPMHRRHRAWATVRVPATAGDDLVGRVRGRMRALVTAIEDAGVRDAHAWPRPAAPDLYAVGLGRTPIDSDTVRAIGRDWERGLTGVRVERVDGGDLPTLC